MHTFFVPENVALTVSPFSNSELGMRSGSSGVFSSVVWPGPLSVHMHCFHALPSRGYLKIDVHVKTGKLQGHPLPRLLALKEWRIKVHGEFFYDSGHCST